MVMNIESLADAALSYGEMGWAVLPVEGKRPRTRHGYKDATAEKPIIRRWWNKHPMDNIGVAPGKSGLLVLDVDPRNGGDETLVKLIQKYGSGFTTTLTTRTGGGGEHYFYNNKEGKLDIGKSILGQGIEFYGNSGYVVAPPSIHPKTGALYEFEDMFSEPKPIPEWLVGQLTRM